MAKKNKTILTWAPNWSKRGGEAGRWKKQVDAKVRFFGHAKSRDDIKAYRAAERKYLEFLQEREATKPVEVDVEDATVSDIAEKYLQNLSNRYERGEVSAGHVEQNRCFLQDFVDRIGNAKRLGEICELDLEDYRNETLRLPTSAATGHRICLRTAKGRLKVVMVLFRWAYKMFLTSRLPRNIDSLSKVTKNGNGAQQPKVKTFTIEELQDMWANANGRTRCYIALALNCGMGQKDIADLRNKEVDWGNGYIERGRSKTNVQSKHKLWSVTLDLLKQHRSTQGDEDRVLLGKNGLSLVRSELTKMQMKHTDAIGHIFVRLLKKQGLHNTGRGFYSLRKTGASCIEKIDPLATEMYLAHAEPGMKKAYAQRDWDRLEKAVVEMEETFSLKQ